MTGTSSAREKRKDNEKTYVVLAGGDALHGRLENLGYEILHELAAGSVYIIRGPEAVEDELRTLPVTLDVLENQTFSAEGVTSKLDAEVSADVSTYEDQWYMERTRAFEAHDVATGDGTTFAVIDTGVDHTHPDLEPQLDIDRSRLFRNGIIHSGTGQINVATETEPVEEFVATDVDGHGSHVAGIAAAPRNETGIIGMAPDATIVSLRPFFFENPTDGFFDLIGTLADLLVAINYAVEIGVDVINVSLSVGNPTPGSTTRRKVFAALNRVVEYAIEQGTVVVTAMGDEAINMNEFPGYVLPASNPGTISVAAVGPNDSRSYYSDYGDSVVTVAAPGGGYETREKTFSSDPDEVDFPFPLNHVLSTVPEPLFGTQYEYLPGTSTAVPQVAGVACLLYELEPNLHPRMIKQALEHGAVQLTGDYTTGLGAGRIDVPATIEYVIDR